MLNYCSNSTIVCEQDVISQNKTLKQYHDASTGQGRGLKALSKQSHDRLEAYQHLFYLLQTNPTYLAKLIFEMPQSRTTKFMESAVLTLYNYASNQREEYLLLRLFKTALEEEIESVSSRYYRSIHCCLLNILTCLDCAEDWEVRGSNPTQD